MSRVLEGKKKLKTNLRKAWCYVSRAGLFMSLTMVQFSRWCVYLTLTACELWCWCKCSTPAWGGVNSYTVFWYDFTYRWRVFRCFVNNTCKSGLFVAVHVLVLGKAADRMDRAPAGTGSKWGRGHELWASAFLPAPSQRRWCPVTHPRPNHSFQSLLLYFLGSSMDKFSGLLGWVATAGGSGHGAELSLQPGPGEGKNSPWRA